MDLWISTGGMPTPAMYVAGCMAFGALLRFVYKMYERHNYWKFQNRVLEARPRVLVVQTAVGSVTAESEQRELDFGPQIVPGSATPPFRH